MWLAAVQQRVGRLVPSRRRSSETDRSEWKLNEESMRLWFFLTCFTAVSLGLWLTLISGDLSLLTITAFARFAGKRCGTWGCTGCRWRTCSEGAKLLLSEIGFIVDNFNGSVTLRGWTIHDIHVYFFLRTLRMRPEIVLWRDRFTEKPSRLSSKKDLAPILTGSKLRRTASNGDLRRELPVTWTYQLPTNFLRPYYDTMCETEYFRPTCLCFWDSSSSDERFQ